MSRAARPSSSAGGGVGDLSDGRTESVLEYVPALEHPSDRFHLAAPAFAGSAEKGIQSPRPLPAAASCGSTQSIAFASGRALSGVKLRGGDRGFEPPVRSPTSARARVRPPSRSALDHEQGLCAAFRLASEHVPTPADASLRPLRIPTVDDAVAFCSADVAGVGEAISRTLLASDGEGLSTVWPVRLGVPRGSATSQAQQHTKEEQGWHSSDDSKRVSCDIDRTAGRTDDLNQPLSPLRDAELSEMLISLLRLSCIGRSVLTG